MFKERKIVVTGGAGMIGSNLVRRLLKENANVIVVDNLWRTGSLDNLKENGNLIIPPENFKNLDLSDYENALSACEGADIVVHLAEIVAGIGFVFNNQSFLFRKNIQINSNVFQACKQLGIKKIFYLGSVCSHPLEKQNKPDSPPLKEEEVYPANPESAYGWSKLMGEYELELLGKEDKEIDIAILRLHNVYGPFCTINPKTSQVIPSLIKKVIESKNHIDVWGSGKQTRDFVYVEDVVDAIMLALEKAWNKGAIQIGSGKATSIADIAREIISSSQKNLEIKFDLTKKEGDIGRVADFTKAKNILGWTPKTSLSKGILKTYNWVEEKHLNQKSL
jgi:nucleoside-diphosphate-sugar epimerase